MTKYVSRALIAFVYVASIVLANVMSAHLGLVGLPFGLLVSAGTFAAGGALLARNLGQDVLGRAVILALMVVGVGLSWQLSTPALAAASAAAFGWSELADMTVYTRLREVGRPRALVAAAAVGALIDSLVFLHLAHFPVTPDSVGGQFAVKLAISALIAAGICYYQRAGGGPIATVKAPRGVRCSAERIVAHLCPVVAESDFGVLHIEWVSPGRTLELHSLRAYLDNWRDVAITHEHMCTAIARDLRRSGVKPVAVTYTVNTAGHEVTVTAR